MIILPSYPSAKEKKNPVTDCIKTDSVVSEKKHSILGQLIFQYYILFLFILGIRHTIHRFRFTGLKIFPLLNNVQLYLQNCHSQHDSFFHTLVIGALIVHWPFAGKIHRERGLQNRHG